MAHPVLFVAGDVHLKDGGGAFAAWLDQLAERHPAHLVLLGDLFDYWLDTDGAVARYAPVLERLKHLGRAGWRVDVVRGNREAVAGRRLECAAGIRLVRRLDLRLGGRRLRIVHGDRLCHDPGYRFLSAWLGSFWHRAWQAGHPAPVQDFVARIMRRNSAGRHHPHPVSEDDTPGIVRRPRVFLDRRKVQAAARGVDTLIAGHIHESWRRRIGGIDLLLVGDWPDTVGHWITGYPDGSLLRHRHDFPCTTN